MQVPENYAETPDGLLLIADGYNPMSIWDGIAAATLPAGIIAPTAAAALAASGAGTSTGAYTSYVRFLDAQGNVSDLSPVSNTVTAASNLTFTYTNVPVSTQAKVVRRQILRNTAGQASTYYVAVDTTDVVSTSFNESLTDTALAANTAVPLFDGNGFPLANTNAPPPAHKAVVAHHLGRMFATVERGYTQGGVIVTNGSATVTGINTEWTAAFAGRFLWVVGASQSYQIQSVNVAAQTLTLTVNYADATDAFAAYGVRPATAERRLVYYSAAGRPQSWPVIYAVSLTEDGDELTGLMSMGSFLYLVERRHLYRFTFQSDPGQDGFVFLAAVRGCINNRCWVVVEDTAYMLDEAGIHAFSGGQSQPISNPIQQMFLPEGETTYINWQASDLFHASWAPAEEVIRWFVCLSGEYLPRHAVCFDYRDQRWWLEEFPRPVSCSATGTYKGARRVFLGANGNKTLMAGVGTLDGPDATAGTTRGNVTSASLYQLTDAKSNWPAAGLVGWPVTIVSGRGEGQRRTVYQVSGQTLYVRDPWIVLPDATSVYQLGGVQWEYQSSWYRWIADEESEPRRVEVLFEPMDEPATMTLQIFKDFAANPIVWKQTQSAAKAEGMASQANSPDLIIDLTIQSGFAQQRIDGHKELNVAGFRWLALRLVGVSGVGQQKVYQLGIDGAQR
jgi:hypothetical protein